MPPGAPLHALRQGNLGSSQGPATSAAASVVRAALALAALFGTSASAAALHRHSDSSEVSALLRREVLPLASTGSEVGEEPLEAERAERRQQLWNNEKQLNKLEKLLRKVHREVGNATANWTIEGQRAIEEHLDELQLRKKMRAIKQWSGRQFGAKGLEKLTYFLNNTCGDSMMDSDMPEEDEVQDEAWEFFSLINDFRSREHECVGRKRKVKTFDPEAALTLDCDLSSAAQRLAEVEAKDAPHSFLKFKSSIKGKASGLCCAIAEGVPLREAALMHTEVIRGPFERKGQGPESAAKAALAIAVETVGSKVCERFGSWKFRRAGVGYHRSADGSQEVFTVIMHKQNECNLPTTCYPSSSQD